MMRATALFALGAVALIAAVGTGCALLWPEPAARRAVEVSAGIALLVQLIAFVVARISSPAHVLAGWGVGMLLRLLSLSVYAVVSARARAVPLAPALVSLVAFFFVTSLLEPVLLKT